MESTEIVNEEMIQDASGEESAEAWFDPESGEYYETGDLNMTEATVEDVTADAEAAAPDVSGTLVLIFLVAMIAGILIWNTFSRRLQ